MRQQHDIVEPQQLGVDRGLVLEDVEPGAPASSPFSSMRVSAASSITSPRAVLTI